MNEAVSGSRFHEPAPGVLEQTGEVGGAGLILHMPIFQKIDHLLIQAERFTPFQNLVDHPLEDRQGLPVLAQQQCCKSTV